MWFTVPFLRGDTGSGANSRQKQSKYYKSGSFYTENPLQPSSRTQGERGRVAPEVELVSQSDQPSTGQLDSASSPYMAWSGPQLPWEGSTAQPVKPQGAELSSTSASAAPQGSALELLDAIAGRGSNGAPEGTEEKGTVSAAGQVSPQDVTGAGQVLIEIAGEGSFLPGTPSDQPFVGKRVAVVEDDALNRLVAKSLCESLGIGVIEFNDGVDIFNKILEGLEVDLVLMDICKYSLWVGSSLLQL